MRSRLLGGFISQQRSVEFCDHPTVQAMIDSELAEADGTLRAVHRQTVNSVQTIRSREARPLQDGASHATIHRPCRIFRWLRPGFHPANVPRR
jgi:hypothetical protein